MSEISLDFKYLVLKWLDVVAVRAGNQFQVGHFQEKELGS